MNSKKLVFGEELYVIVLCWKESDGEARREEEDLSGRLFVICKESLFNIY